MLGEQIQNTDEKTVLKAVALISKRKTYQIGLILFLGIIYHTMNISMLSPTILFMNPMFTCEGGTKEYTEDEACHIMQFCTPTNKQTLTAELELYCDGRKDDRNLIQSMTGIGSLLGVLMINWLADRKGKRFCIFLSLALASISAFCLLTGILHKDIELVMISQFLIGYAYGAYGTLIFFLGSKYLSELSSYVVLIFYLCGTGSAQISIAILNEFFPGWHSYVGIYVASFTLAILAGPFIIKEDPVYLYNNGQMDELMVLVESVGKANKATVQQMQQAENQLSRIDKSREKRTPQLRELIPKEMRSMKTLLLIGIMACCSFTTNSVYFGIGFEIQKFGFSITNSMLIFGFSEIVNYLLTMSIMPYLPSVRAILYICAVVPSLACFSFFCDSITQSMMLQMGITVIIRFLITTYGSFYITYYVENLPKKVEGTSAGLIESFGSLGKVAAPYAVRISEDRKINPMGVFGLIYFIIGFLPLLFLPKDSKETNEQPIADTIPGDSAVK